MTTVWIIVIISLCLCIIGLLIGSLTFKREIISEYKTLQDCTDDKQNVCKDTKNCCVYWDEDYKKCKKGRSVDGHCKSISNTLSFFFIVIGLISFIVLTISLIAGLVEYFGGRKTTFSMTNSVFRLSKK